MAAKKNNKDVKQEQQIIEIEPLTLGSAKIRLNGDGILVTHALDAETRQRITRKQTGEDTETTREFRSPVEEFMNATYPVHGPAKPKPRMKDGQKIYNERAVKSWASKTKFGIPIVAFKNAIVSAGRNTSTFTMKQLRQILHVIPADPKYPDSAIINAPTPPIMRSDMVKIGNNIPMERFRPQWNNWSVDIVIKYDYDSINVAQVANMLAKAGQFVGVMEGRPEKCGLSWGRFNLGQFEG